jgi:hypothetical protein
MITEQVFLANMAGLFEYFNKKASEPLTAIYWRKLKHLTDQDFITAVDCCIDNLKFFPKVPEIMEHVPAPLAIESKGSLEWCDNTARLMAKYPPETAKIKRKDHG